MLPLVLLLALSQPPPDRLTVSAAVSMTEALEEVAGAYRAAGGGQVVFNFGGSNVLARQIASRAPVDVFVSADEAQMDVVDRAGMIAPGTRGPVTANQLVIVVRSDGRQVTSVKDLLAPDVRRIAIGDPSAVPAGVYARQYLERIGLWAQLDAKVVPTGNVRAALTAVRNGSADAAIVYATDARTTTEVRVAVTISGEGSPVIAYPAAALKTSRNPPAAQRFVEFLRGPVAQGILERHGFLRLPPRK